MNRLVLTIVAVLGLAACGQAVGARTSTSLPKTGAPLQVRVATNAALGQILTTEEGKTLYYFTPERGGVIACTGPCTTVWPPLLAGPGGIAVDAPLLGTLATVVRAGGKQVTYSEWPLYTFSGDKAPGDVNGQGILGKWFVATTALTDAPIAGTPPTQTPTPAPTAPPVYRVPVTPTNCIPGANGGDHDADNNGGLTDGDGCQ